MSLIEKYQKWRSLLQVEQIKFLTIAERALISAVWMYEKSPNPVTEELVKNAREHLHRQRELAEEAQQELEDLIRRDGGDRP